MGSTQQWLRTALNPNKPQFRTHPTHPLASCMILGRTSPGLCLQNEGSDTHHTHRYVWDACQHSHPWHMRDSKVYKLLQQIKGSRMQNSVFVKSSNPTIEINAMGLRVHILINQPKMTQTWCETIEWALQIHVPSLVCIRVTLDWGKCAFSVLSPFYQTAVTWLGTWGARLWVTSHVHIDGSWLSLFFHHLQCLSPSLSSGQLE